MREEWRSIDQRINGYDSELDERVRNEDTAKRLISIHEIGVLTATALVAAVGHAQTFSCGRDLAAWLGLVPRQATTGGKPRLLHISKRGNGYLRMLLIHGARTALPGLAKKDTPLGRWVKALLARAHRNVVTVALANKLARIAWAVLARDHQYVAVQAIGKSFKLSASEGPQSNRGFHHICERKERDGLTVDRRPGNLTSEMAILPRAESFMRTRTRGSPSWPERTLRGRIHYCRLIETNSQKSTCRSGAGHTFGSDS